MTDQDYVVLSYHDVDKPARYLAWLRAYQPQKMLGEGRTEEEAVEALQRKLVAQQGAA